MSVIVFSPSSFPNQDRTDQLRLLFESIFTLILLNNGRSHQPAIIGHFFHFKDVNCCGALLKDVFTHIDDFSCQIGVLIFIILKREVEWKIE